MNDLNTQQLNKIELSLAKIQQYESNLGDKETSLNRFIGDLELKLKTVEQHNIELNAALQKASNTENHLKTKLEEANTNHITQKSHFEGLLQSQQLAMDASSLQLKDELLKSMDTQRNLQAQLTDTAASLERSNDQLAQQKAVNEQLQFNHNELQSALQRANAANQRATVDIDDLRAQYDQLNKDKQTVDLFLQQSQASLQLEAAKHQSKITQVDDLTKRLADLQSEYEVCRSPPLVLLISLKALNEANTNTKESTNDENAALQNALRQSRQKALDLQSQLQHQKDGFNLSLGTIPSLPLHERSLPKKPNRLRLQSSINCSYKRTPY